MITDRWGRGDSSQRLSVAFRKNLWHGTPASDLEKPKRRLRRLGKEQTDIGLLQRFKAMKLADDGMGLRKEAPAFDQDPKPAHSGMLAAAESNIKITACIANHNISGALRRPPHRLAFFGWMGESTI